MTSVRTAVLLALSGTSLALTPAQAVVIGVIQVTPAKGTDATLFSGVVDDARCPTNTADSYFSIDGPGLPRDQAILAPGNSTGTGRQTFSTQAIANIKTINSGSFLQSGTYTLRFNCVRTPDGKVTNTYERALRYVAGGSGSWTLVPAPAFSPPPRPAKIQPSAAAPTASPGAVVPGPSASSVPQGGAGGSSTGRPGDVENGAGGSAIDGGLSPALFVGVGAAVIVGLAGLATVVARRRRRDPA